MRVICIDDSPSCDGVVVNGEVVKVGEIYTVKNVHKYSMDRNGHIDAVPCYEFYEITEYVGFPCKNFIPLSNIDEKELLEERELQFQNA